ncbi:MAG TPA: tetratricopeptide repeat protein, partial [Methylomirabilota bacterium]|nr:tetratricopeptide repeat protein [Methylomirabilota bacterium]
MPVRRPSTIAGENPRIPEKRTGDNGSMRRLQALVPIVIALVTCLAFWPTLQGEFNWDDEANLVNNPHYRGFGAPQLRWMFSTTLMGHYMPLTWLSLAVDYTFGRMNPWRYHVTSLLLHALNAVLFYLVARRLLVTAVGSPSPGTRAPRWPQDADSPSPLAIVAGALVAAFLFALHPQRVESVAWISDRGTLLCATFYLLAVLAYLRGIVSPVAPGGRWWRMASLAAFAAALLSKGMAVSLPVSLLVLDVYPLHRREGWRRLLIEKAPYVTLALLGAAVTLTARNEGAAFSGYASYGLASRIALAGYSIWFYPLTLVWPANLSPLYEVPRSVSLLAPRFLVPTVAVVVVTAGLIALRRRLPGALAAWAHSAAVVAPVSGIVHSGLQLVADRYAYLAQMGFIVLAGYGIVWVLQIVAQGRVPCRAVALTGGGVTAALLALSSLTWSQSYAWHDPEMLWRWAVDVDPACARCHHNLGAALMRRRRDEAGLRASEEHLRRAIALSPDHAEAYLSLGTVALMRRRFAEAESALREYMRMRPNARAGPERLAVLYLVQSRPDEAIPLLRRAHQMTGGPDVPVDRGSTTGSADAGGGGLTEAVQLLNDSETLRYLGQALLEQGLTADAIVPLRRAVALDPTASAARFWLAQAYRGAG